MGDIEVTQKLAAAAGATISGAELAPLFAVPTLATEWSLNRADNPRGSFRISVWTHDREMVTGTLARTAPELLRERERLGLGTLEGLGLAYRPGQPHSLRWWGQVEKPEADAARVLAAWPEDRDAIESFLTAAGGRRAFTAVGIELEGSRVRPTVYAHLYDPIHLEQILELAGADVRRSVQQFFEGVLTVRASGRAWPKIWIGLGLRGDRAWKLYYFAHGDSQRLDDEALLEIAGADEATFAAWRALGETVAGPRVQLLGFTVSAATPPAWTVYLGAR